MTNLNPIQPFEFPGIQEEIEVRANKLSGSSVLNINKMLSHNLIKSSKFAAKFLSAPLIFTDILSDSTNVLRDMTFLCDSVEFPGQSLSSVDYKISGRQKIKVPFSREVNEVNFTFYENDKIPLYLMFNSWIEEISPNNAQNMYFDDIVATIELTSFNDVEESGSNPLAHTIVKLIDVYPISVQSMPANWADEGFQKVNVSFFVSRFE